MKNLKKQQGVGMIEVLITFLLISIGVLGVSTMQRFTLKENMDTAQRSQVVWVIQDIAERIRNNSSVSALSAYESNLKSYIDDKSKCPASVATNCQTSLCNASDLAAYDSWDVACKTDSTNISSASDNIILTGLTIECYNSQQVKQADCTAINDFVNVKLDWQRLVKKEDDSTSVQNNSFSFLMVP